MLRRTQPHLVKEAADVFITGSWAYHVSDIIGALETQVSQREDDDLFIWMDLLILNQHKMEQYDTEFWMNKYLEMINKIERTIVIISSLDNGVYGICVVHFCDETKMSLITIPSQRQVFRKALKVIFEGLVAQLEKIDVTKAQTWNKKDQRMILSAAQTANGGIGAMQEIVIGSIQKWMTSEAIALIDELESNGDDINLNDLAHLCDDVGLLLRRQGLLNLAEKYCRKGIALFKQLHDHENVVICSKKLALLFYEQGKFT
jgi:hypothetical protein